MTRANRSGINIDAYVVELNERLFLVQTELERLEAEHERYRHALQRITHEGGSYGFIAHEALHPREENPA